MSVVLDRCMIHADVFNNNDVFRCTHKDKGALHRMDEQAVPIFGDLVKGYVLILTGSTCQQPIDTNEKRF